MFKKLLTGIVCGALLQGCEPTHYINNKYLFFHEKSYNDVMADGFSKRKLPIFTTQDPSQFYLFERYSLSAAMRDKTYYDHVPDVQTNLVQRLKERTHIKRTDAYYDESSQQISRITNKTFLSLIKQYIDLFDSMDVEDFSSLFPDDYSNESGGIILHDTHLKLVGLENMLYGADAKDHYTNNDLNIYSQTGVYHTHSLNEFSDECVDGNYYVYAGPSGFPYFEESTSLHSIDGGDLGFFRSRKSINPYYVDAVITELKYPDSLSSVPAHSYNVDIYFLHDTLPMVLDIGTYSFEEKKKK